MQQYTANPFLPENPLCEEHLSILRSRSLAHVTHRAETLLKSGRYVVIGPFPVARYSAFSLISAQGEEFIITLSMTPSHPVFGDLCACAAFEEYGECEHHLAILIMLRDEALRKPQEEELRRYMDRFPCPFTDVPGDAQ